VPAAPPGAVAAVIASIGTQDRGRSAGCAASFARRGATGDNSGVGATYSGSSCTSASTDLAAQVVPRGAADEHVELRRSGNPRGHRDEHRAQPEQRAPDVARESCVTRAGR
jgi:hypothetical protein